MPPILLSGLRRLATHLGCAVSELLALTTLALGAIALLGSLWWLQRPGSGEGAASAALPLATAPSIEVLDDPARSPPVADQAATTAPVRVHVAGEVTTPGVYELRTGARVVDAVAAAGGATAEADLDAVNLAQPVTDGMQIRVPAPGEPATAIAAPGGAAASGGGARVDLNTADAATLETLPGVGPVTAQRILEHRAESGPFRSVDELLDVPGIGDSRLAELADRVTVVP